MIEALSLGDYANYFNWLIDRVGGDAWWSDYGDILVRLFERSFYYGNVIDGNLVSFVENLRANAMMDDFNIIVPSGDARVLEVLIDLAIRIDILFTRSDEPSRAPKRFDDFMDVLNFKTDLDHLDNQIDRFLDGKNQITRHRAKKPYTQTLWSQVNEFYLDEFKMEDDFS